MCGMRTDEGADDEEEDEGEPSIELRGMEVEDDTAGGPSGQQGEVQFNHAAAAAAAVAQRTAWLAREIVRFSETAGERAGS